MAVDPRDQIWNATFDTYYDVFFEELISDDLVATWQILDEFTKVIVALTASGSAFAGWALWQDPDWKWLWALIAGVSAIISIIHSALGVPGRLKTHGDNRRLFTSLRIDLETFRSKMQIDPQFPIPAFSEELFGLRKRYGAAMDRFRDDILATNKRRDRIQTELDQRITDKIEQPPEAKT